MEKIGFIGLGAMGAPMAENLVKKGLDLIVYDLSDDAVQRLVAAGAGAARSVAEVAEKSDIIITMLPNSPDVAAVVTGPGGIIEHGRPEQLVMDMSTIDPSATDDICARLGDAGIGFVDAPVGRLVTHAIAGESLFMVGASDNHLGRVRPMLERMGTTIHHCGGPGSGIRTKLVNNLIAISVCQVNAEAIALATHFGLDPKATLDVVNGTTATNGHLVTAWPIKVLAGDTDPGFRIRLAQKDVSLALNAAQSAGLPMPAGSAVREALTLASGSAGYSEKDFSALLDFACETAGITPPRF